MAQITVIYKHANFRALPPNKNKPDRKPYSIIEFMGGSQLVANDKLIPDVEMADEIHCSASMMGQSLRIDGVEDVRKGGKSLLKDFKIA